MKIILALALIYLVGCSTTSQAPTTASPLPATPRVDGSGEIDFFALKTHLQMDRDRESLGLAEKTFNTCGVGYGYSSSQNCRVEHFVVLNFRLLCRDSEGTISQVLTDADLRPLERRSVNWQLKGVRGVTYTDSDGYGQIMTSSLGSQRTQRVRIAIGNEFLYMRAGELQKVITPKNWCNQY